MGIGKTGSSSGSASSFILTTDAVLSCPVADCGLALSSEELFLGWTTVVHDATDLAPFEAALTAKELNVASRFRRHGDRAGYVLAHGLLRRLLAAFCAVPAQELRFRTGPFGKPLLESGALSFSISHCGSTAIVAISSPEMTVGIDIERVREIDDMETIVRRYFSPLEYAAWCAQPHSARQQAFFRLWTRKEAVLKATGEGLQRSLSSFTVSCDMPPELLAPAPPAWSLHDLAEPAGYVGAVAAAPQPLSSTF